MLITISASGINSLNVPTLKLFDEAFLKDSFLLSIEDCLKTVRNIQTRISHI